MKNVRLLPVVIFAAIALLVFKSVGLMTQGGYVLTGVSFAQAAGGGGGHGGDAAGGEAAADGGPTMTDTSPTLEDSAPTLPDPKAAGGGDHGGAPAADHGAEPAAEGEAASTDHATDGSDAAEGDHAETADACAPVEGEGGGDHGGGEAAPATPGDITGLVPIDCVPREDAVPMMVDKTTGQLMPVAEAEGADNSEKAVLESLSERRTELDTRDAELAMRLSLIEAAEQRVAERQAALETLQAQVEALVQEKKAAEEEQFKGLVSMYETMKPKDAALIFNELDPKVLLRVAKAMNPRKMAPIMAKMLPEKAQRLTVGLAAEGDTDEPTATMADMQALPQIVGQ